MTGSALRVAALAWKELLTVLTDPKSRLVVFAPPVLQFFLFGYAATFDVTAVRTAVLDESRTPASRELVSGLLASPAFEVVETLDSPDQIAGLIDRQAVRIVVHVGPQFERELLAGVPTAVQVIADGRNSNVSSVAAGYVSRVVDRFNAGFTARRGPPAGSPTAAAGPGGPTIELVDRSWFNPNLRSRWTIVAPLAATIAMVVVMLLASLSVAREREFGTFDQLLVAPFRPWEVLVGKAVPGVVFGLFDASVLTLGAAWWFEVPFRGSVAAVALTLLLFVVAVTGVGLFVSSLSTTMQQGLLGAFVFIVPAVILSGFTTPIENMPDWLQTGTLVNPLRFAVAALRRVSLEGVGVAEIFPQLWPMALIAAVTLPLAGWMFIRRSG